MNNVHYLAEDGIINELTHYKFQKLNKRLVDKKTDTILLYYAFSKLGVRMSKNYMSFDKMNCNRYKYYSEIYFSIELSI